MSADEARAAAREGVGACPHRLSRDSVARVSTFRVAFVQGAPRFGRAAENLERGLALAAGIQADLVVLPELWSSGYVFSSHAEVASLAEDAAGGHTARALLAAARRAR